MTYYCLISNTGITWELQRKEGDTWVTLKEFPYDKFDKAREYYYDNYNKLGETWLMQNSNRLW